MMMMIGGNGNQDFVLDCRTKVAILFVFQIKAFAVIWIDVWGFLQLQWLLEFMFCLLSQCGSNKDTYT
jgi:hypothetical protein